jgi:hypothetical protein
MKTPLLVLFTLLFLTAKSQTPEALTVTNVNILSNDWCGLSTGAITTSTSGGTPPYTYLWSNGATTSAIYNLTAGTYEVTVTDDLGSTGSATAQVEYIGQPPYYIIAINQSHVGLNDGKIYTGLYPNMTGSANGFADGTYDYILYDASFNIVDSQVVVCSGGVFNGDPYFDVINLSPGAYSLTCGYNGWCSTSYSFQINDIPDVIPTFTSSSACNGSPTGKVFANLHQNPSINSGTYNMNVTGGIWNTVDVCSYQVRMLESGVL